MYRSKYDYIGYQNTIFVLVLCVYVVASHRWTTTTVSNSDLNNLINYTTDDSFQRNNVQGVRELEES